MRPYSRGKPPIEFSLRVSCELGQQFSLDDTSTPHEFDLRGVHCKATHQNGCLLITATSFQSLEEAREFFYELQSYIAYVSLKDRVAISVPTQLAEPVKAAFSFMAEDTCCTSHGWPPETIRPWLISNLGACVYPEHEYVAIDEVLRVVPLFSYSLASFVKGLRVATEQPSTSEPVDDVLLVAIAGYAQASRSTQWVWSFLLTVMMLEMLAIETPSSDETRAVVKNLYKIAKLAYGEISSVDLERICTCVNYANSISKTSAVRALVRKRCAPGVSPSPLTHLYADAADCDRKVGAIYNVRSKYAHEGRVASPGELKYTLAELHNIATESLGHILRITLSARQEEEST